MGFDLGSIIGGSLGETFKNVVGAFKLDPEKKAEFQTAIDANATAIHLKELEMAGNAAAAVTTLALAQVEVNKVEAASPDLFKSGWRPFCGWICGFGLGYQFVARPLLTWIAAFYGGPAAPSLDMGTLLTLLGGLLGLGALRTTEKMSDKD